MTPLAVVTAPEVVLAAATPMPTLLAVLPALVDPIAGLTGSLAKSSGRTYCRFTRMVKSLASDSRAPAGNSTFWAVRAAATSSTVIPRAAMASALSQMRMA